METKEQAIARCALAIEFNLPDTKGTTRSILAALSAAYSAGFEAGFTAANEHHARAMQLLDEALANRPPPRDPDAHT